MKKKLRTLSFWSFQQEAGKPFVTLLLGILGVLFLFGSIMSLLIAHIIFKEET